MCVLARRCGFSLRMLIDLSSPVRSVASRRNLYVLLPTDSIAKASYNLVHDPALWWATYHGALAFVTALHHDGWTKFSEVRYGCASVDCGAAIPIHSRTSHRVSDGNTLETDRESLRLCGWDDPPQDHHVGRLQAFGPPGKNRSISTSSTTRTKRPSSCQTS